MADGLPKTITLSDGTTIPVAWEILDTVNDESGMPIELWLPVADWTRIDDNVALDFYSNVYSLNRTTGEVAVISDFDLNQLGWDYPTFLPALKYTALARELMKSGIEPQVFGVPEAESFLVEQAKAFTAGDPNELLQLTSIFKEGAWRTGVEPGQPVTKKVWYLDEIKAGATVGAGDTVIAPSAKEAAEVGATNWIPERLFDRKKVAELTMQWQREKGLGISMPPDIEQQARSTILSQTPVKEGAKQTFAMGGWGLGWTAPKEPKKTAEELDREEQERYWNMLAKRVSARAQRIGKI